jgi:hypothetical protein
VYKPSVDSAKNNSTNMTTTLTDTATMEPHVSNAAEKLRVNGLAVDDTDKLRPTSRATARKYNHLFAIHAQKKASCLTNGDAAETPSYAGFRNLMVLMLGKVTFEQGRDKTRA